MATTIEPPLNTTDAVENLFDNNDDVTVTSNFASDVGDGVRHYTQTIDIMPSDIVSTFTSATIKNTGIMMPASAQGHKADVTGLDISPYVQILNNVFQKNYRPYVAFMANFAPFNPRRKQHYQNINDRDLFSFTYTRQPLRDMDNAVNEHLESFLKKLKAGQNTQTDYDAFQKKWDVIRARIEGMPVPYGMSTKFERIRAMLEYMDLVENNVKILKQPPSGDKSDQAKRHKAFRFIRNVADESTVRVTGKKPVIVERNGKPTVIRYDDVGAEDIERLERQVNERFIPSCARDLPIENTLDIFPNGENFNEMIKNFVKDADGNPIDMTTLTDASVELFASWVANLYRLGREEEALSALSYLKMQEGAESRELIPTGFREKLRKELAADFRSMRTPDHPKGKDIDDDDHFQYFNEKIKNVLTKRKHSPRPTDEREVDKLLATDLITALFPKFIAEPINSYLPKKLGLINIDGGRRYAALGKGKEVATPVMAGYVEEPAYRIKQKVRAYLTGGYVVPLSAIGEDPDSEDIAEKTVGTRVLKNNWFTWRAEATDEEEHLKPYDSKWLGRAPLPICVPLRFAALPFKAAKVGLKAGKTLAWNKVTKTALKYSALIGGAVGATMLIGPAAVGAAAATPIGMGAIALVGGPLVYTKGMKVYRVATNLKAAVKAARNFETFGCTDKNGNVLTVAQKLADKSQNGSEQQQDAPEAEQNNVDTPSSDVESTPDASLDGTTPSTEPTADFNHMASSTTSDLQIAALTTQITGLMEQQNRLIAENLKLQREFMNRSGAPSTSEPAGSPIVSSNANDPRSAFMFVNDASIHTPTDDTVLDNTTSLSGNVIAFDDASTRFGFSIDTTSVNDQPNTDDVSGKTSASDKGPATPGFD